jgi:HlyD family secretion protein
MSRKVLVLLLVLVLAVIGGSTWWSRRGDAAHEIKRTGEGDLTATSPESEAAAPSLVRVDVIKPRTGGLARQTSQPGTVQAFESVEMLAKVSGFLKTQAVDIGDVVKRGDVLAVIDAPELEKDVDEAAAAVEQAKAGAALAEARVATSEAEREAVAATVAQAEADIAQQVARRTLSEKQLERIKGLYARDAVSRELVDEQEHDVQAAQAGERSVRSALLTAKAQLAASAAKVLQAKADVAEAKSAIRLAEARAERARVISSFTQIVAPFDGVITARAFHPGAFIHSAAEGSTKALLTVMRTDRMRVVVQVPDLVVALLDVGDPGTVVVDALKGRSFAGSVSRLARAENPATRTMRVEIDVENPGGVLCEGMYGRATIELRGPSKGLAVPAGCVLGHSTGGKAKVYVVRDGHVRLAAVSLGAEDGAMTEVFGDLKPEDVVVLNARGGLDEGMAVETNLVQPGEKAH